MTDSRGRIIWRVRTADSSSRTNAFDALVLASDSAARDQLRPTRVIAADVPFERELPDLELTLIVRSNPAEPPLIVECDVLNADGSRRLYGRAHNPLAVLMCSERGIIVTGLPEPASAAGAPAT
jgi:hypothetical protein